MAPVPEPPPTGGLPSVAVLPVAVEEPDGARLRFVGGLAREIVGGLSHFSTVMVFAADTTFAYAGDGVPPREIARRLGASYLVSADAAWFDDFLRVSVQLQYGATAEVLWAATFERPAEGLLEIQEEVVEKVVRLVGPADGALGPLREAELERVGRMPTDSPDAYGHFLRGLVLFETYAPEGTAEAIKALDRAVTADPGYGRAHAYAGWAELQHFRNGWGPEPEAALLRAEARAERAVAVDTQDPYGHWTLGAVRLYQRRHSEAVAAYGRAVDLNPQNAEMLIHAGWAMVYAGRPEEGLRYMGRRQWSGTTAIPAGTCGISGSPTPSPDAIVRPSTGWRRAARGRPARTSFWRSPTQCRARIRRPPRRVTPCWPPPRKRRWVTGRRWSPSTAGRISTTTSTRCAWRAFPSSDGTGEGRTPRRIWGIPVRSHLA
jgi:TolB-like protein